MRNGTRIKLAAALLVAGVCTGTGTAHADMPFAQAITWSKPQASAGLRFGSNHLNLGIGARGGYTLPQGFYVGGLFDYFLGENGFHLFDLGGEVGYDFAITPVMMVRPFVGLGFASARVCVGDICDGETDTFIELGGQFDYFRDRIFYGGELRIMSANDTAIVLGGHVGLTF